MGHCPAIDSIQMGAMDFFSDTQATASSFGDVIDDLHDVFRCHGVDYGSPDDFLAFARTMKYHSELCSDVMRVVKFVMDSETNVTFRILLTIIAVASGGPEVATAGRDMKVPVSLIIESLVGAGDLSPLNGEVPEGSSPEPLANEATEAVVLERSSSGKEPVAAMVTGRMLLEEPADDPSGGDHLEDHPLMGHSDSNALAESLSRIELNSVHLKIYLDSIEQRLSRMEPRLENVPPVALSDQPAPMKEKAARFSAAVVSETFSSAAEFELQHNEPARVEPVQQAASAMRSPVVPGHLWEATQQFFAMKRQRAVPFLGGVAILLFAAVVFWWVGRDTGYAVIHPASRSVQAPDNAGGFGSGVAVAAGDVETAKRNSDGPIESGAWKQTRHSANAPVALPKKPAGDALRSPLSSSPSGDAKTAANLTEASDETDLTDRTYKANLEPLPGHPVNVSSGVMAANLISSPKPDYPKLASLTRMRGDVVMLAVISKDGTVKDLHVIQGHRLLRGAAKKAVRNWRYRPYKINGVPVDVSTLVRVDFSSHE